MIPSSESHDEANNKKSPMLIALESVKNSLRIDHEADDDLLMMLMATADEYVCSAITHEVEGHRRIRYYPQYQWAMSLLAQHWYLNREEATNAHVPYTVTALIQQMRGKYYADY